MPHQSAIYCHWFSRARGFSAAPTQPILLSLAVTGPSACALATNVPPRTITAKDGPHRPRCLGITPCPSHPALNTLVSPSAITVGPLPVFANLPRDFFAAPHPSSPTPARRFRDKHTQVRAFAILRRLSAPVVAARVLTIATRRPRPFCLRCPRLSSPSNPGLPRARHHTLPRGRAHFGPVHPQGPAALPLCLSGMNWALAQWKLRRRQSSC